MNSNNNGENQKPTQTLKSPSQQPPQQSPPTKPVV